MKCEECGKEISEGKEVLVSDEEDIENKEYVCGDKCLEDYWSH